jgi:hypothetical protein
MALNTFAFVPSNKFVNKAVNQAVPYNGYLFEKMAWEYIQPFDEEFIIPSVCPAVPEYIPGYESAYWDYNQLWVGYPTFTVTWPVIPKEDVEIIQSAYRFAFKYTNTRCWFYQMNGETGNWQIRAGFMDEPKQNGYKGDAIANFSMTFTRIGFNMNEPNLQDTTQIYGGSGDFRNSNWDLTP